MRENRNRCGAIDQKPRQQSGCGEVLHRSEDGGSGGGRGAGRGQAKGWDTVHSARAE